MEEWQAGESERGKSLRKGQAPAEHSVGNLKPHLTSIVLIEDCEQSMMEASGTTDVAFRLRNSVGPRGSAWSTSNAGSFGMLATWPPRNRDRPLSLSSLRWWLQESFTHNQGGISHLLSSLGVVSQQSQDKQPGLATSYTYSPASSGAFAILHPMSLDMSMLSRLE